MRRILLSVLAVTTLAALPAMARDRVSVGGVGDDDMLKLRAGPGTGFSVIVGLPDGTDLIRRKCLQVGGTSWCRVSLVAAPRLSGYVAGRYLRE